MSRAPGSERPTGQWITDPDGLRWFLDTGAVSHRPAPPPPRGAPPGLGAPPLGVW